MELLANSMDGEFKKLKKIFSMKTIAMFAIQAVGNTNSEEILIIFTEFEQFRVSLP